MKSTATVLSATSNETTVHTVGAVDTSNEAFGSVQVAATAADELSKSIAEINRQLVRAWMWCEPLRRRRNRPTKISPGWRKRRRRSTMSSSSFRAWPGRPICWRSMPRSRRRGRERPARASPSSPPKSKRLPCRPPRRRTTSPRKFRRCSPRRKAPLAPSATLPRRMQEIRQFTAAIATSVEQQNAATREISSNVAAAASGTKSVVSVLQARLRRHRRHAFVGRHGPRRLTGCREGRGQPARQRRWFSPQGRHLAHDPETPELRFG